MQGIIRQDGTGLATFTIEYQCIVCRPYKGEVMDCIVASVNKVRPGQARLTYLCCHYNPDYNHAATAADGLLC